MNGLSIVVPAHNEEENVGLLSKAVNEVLAQMPFSYEIIFIEDGSTDNTFSKLIDLKKDQPNLKIIKLRERCGQAICLAVGILQSSNDIIITMDSDLQDNPKDIPRFLDKLQNDYDFVCGWRKNRKDPWKLKIIVSKIGNFILSGITKIKIHDFSCTFKAFHKDAAVRIAKKIRPGYHRFIPLIGKELNLAFCEVETDHQARVYGKSKYSLLKIFKAALDLSFMRFNLKNRISFSDKDFINFIEKIY